MCDVAHRAPVADLSLAPRSPPRPPPPSLSLPRRPPPPPPSSALRYLNQFSLSDPLRRSTETTSKRPLRSLREHDAHAPRDRHRRRSCRGAELAWWSCPPLNRCGVPSTARPPSSPWLCVWPIWAGTPGRARSNPITWASLSHRPSHASPSQIDNLANWTLTPSRSSSALFNYGHRGHAGGLESRTRSRRTTFPATCRG